MQIDVGIARYLAYLISDSGMVIGDAGPPHAQHHIIALGDCQLQIAIVWKLSSERLSLCRASRLLQCLGDGTLTTHCKGLRPSSCSSRHTRGVSSGPSSLASCYCCPGVVLQEFDKRIAASSPLRHGQPIIICQTTTGAWSG